MITVKTLPCPGCGGTADIEVDPAQAQMLGRPRWDRPRIQVILADKDADTRERFVSGYCPKCWNEVFKS